MGKHKKTIGLNLFVGISILAYLSVYIFLPYILGGGHAAYETAIKFALMFAMLFLVCNQKSNQQSINDTTFLQLGVAFCALQLVFIHNTGAIRLLVNIVTFFLLARYTKQEVMPFYTWGMKIATIILSLSAILLAIRYGYLFFYRDETLVDKQFYTCMLGISSILCLVDIIRQKYSILNAVMLIFFLLVNVLIIQSKLSLFSLGIVTLIAFIAVNKERKKRFRVLLYWGIGAYVVIAYFYPDLAIPDQIKYGVNKLFNSNIFTIETKTWKLDETYDLRAGLWDFCLNLFYDHPFLGIGVGNFKEYNTGLSFISHLNETESSLLSIICEGGIYYIVLMFYLFYFMIKRAYSSVKNGSEVGLIALCVIATYLILIIGNDFLDSLFWISFGLMAGAMQSEKTIYAKGRTM